MSNSSRKKGLGAGAAAIFVAATLAMFGISTDKVIEADYSVEEQGNIAEMSIDIPEEMSVDIVELLCNGETVTKALMPNGKLMTIPLVFSNLDNLELRLYKRGEVIGVGRFEGDKLHIALRDDAGEVKTDENE